jgi:hypothetical protein
MIYISSKREVTVGGLDRTKYLEAFREYERRQQSRKDYTQSGEITKNHTRYPCRNRTQCKICSHIRHLLRSIKHNANPEHKNRKCPVCYWNREAKYISGRYGMRADLYEKNSKVLIKYLYFGLLNGKHHWRMPRCGWLGGKMYIR